MFKVPIWVSAVLRPVLARKIDEVDTEQLEVMAAALQFLSYEVNAELEVRNRQIDIEDQIKIN